MQLLKRNFSTVALSLCTISLLPSIALAAQIRVATWNICNYLICDRRVNGQFRPAYPKPEIEKTAIRKILHVVQPDILALQEIGGISFLKELQNDLSIEGTHYPFFALIEANDPDRKIAVLSKYPFKAVVPHTGIQFTLQGQQQYVKRGLLELQFETYGKTWTLYIVHLRSHYTTHAAIDNQEEREAESRAIAAFIRKAHPLKAHTYFLIAGDFNNTLGTIPLKAFLKTGKYTFTRRVPAADSLGAVWTHYYAKEGIYSRIDYILASPDFWPHIANQTAYIADLMPESSIGSDHRLVYMDLSL
jgi:endonuclease/exonuclease/phosphatase family metal-dependent hydrolase